MKDEKIFLPLFPTSGVILPYGSMILRANQEPYIQLVRNCIENDSLFISVYFDENGIYDIGCACQIINHEVNENEIWCQIYALRRVSINSIISIEDGCQKIFNNGKEIHFKLDEPIDDLPYQMVNGNIFIDTNTDVREDIKNQVFDKFKNIINNKYKETYNEFINLSKKELDEGISFFILNNLIGDHSKDENAIRYNMISKKSENKRLRILRNLIC